MKPSHAVVTIRRRSPAKGDSDSVRVDIDIRFNVSGVSVVLSDILHVTCVQQELQQPNTSPGKATICLHPTSVLSGSALSISCLVEGFSVRVESRSL